MKDNNLRLFVTVFAPSPKLLEETTIWLQEKRIEMYKTGLFERIVRHTPSDKNHSFVYGFMLKDEKSLENFQNEHLHRLISDFQKKFPKTKNVQIIPVLGEMETTE
jgi:hypothetical protein